VAGEALTGERVKQSREVGERAGFRAMARLGRVSGIDDRAAVRRALQFATASFKLQETQLG
jgi:hypothetical protein